MTRTISPSSILCSLCVFVLLTQSRPASGDETPAPAVSTISGPLTNNLGGLLRMLNRDPEIKYLYSKVQEYIVGRIQRAAVGEPRVGDEEEIFNDLLENHSHSESKDTYSADEREVVKNKIVKLVKLLGLTHVVSGHDL